MLFYITNKNADIAFPALLRAGLPVVEVTDKKTGTVQMCVDISELTDLLSLDSACQVGNEWYTGMTVSGNKITLNEGSKYYD